MDKNLHNFSHLKKAQKENAEEVRRFFEKVDERHDKVMDDMRKGARNFRMEERQRFNTVVQKTRKYRDPNWQIQTNENQPNNQGQTSNQGQKKFDEANNKPSTSRQ